MLYLNVGAVSSTRLLLAQKLADSLAMTQLHVDSKSSRLCYALDALVAAATVATIAARRRCRFCFEVCSAVLVVALTSRGLFGECVL